MIDACFNPKCGKPLYYLREGRVIRAVRKQRGAVVIEHFWLCGDCYKHYKFEFSVDALPALIAEATADRWVRTTKVA